MTHEEFVSLTRQAARNAQGLRPLAGHVRRLYGAIRSLQEDDNSFFYIAEVIQQARNDTSDTFAFMSRVKTYYNRDRKAAGDPRVARGIRRHPPASTASPVTKEPASSTITTPSRSEGEPGAGITWDRTDVGTPLPEPSDTPAATTGPATHPAPHNRDDLRALTAALHGRPGRRRIASGG